MVVNEPTDIIVSGLYNLYCYLMSNVEINNQCDHYLLVSFTTLCHLSNLPNSLITLFSSLLQIAKF